MTRKETYALIKKYNLSEKVKQLFGDNYTRVSTDKLEQVIKKCISEADCWGDSKAPMADTAHTDTAEELNNPYEAACVAFVGILKDNGLLDNILAKL